MAYKQILFCVTFLFLMVGAAKADLFEGALEAYDKGEYKRAALLFEMLAEKGDLKAQVMIGSMYLKGEGVTKNYANTVKWYSLAAEQGSPVAKGELGGLFMFGTVVPQNFKMGLRYLLQAAEGGYHHAMGVLGVAYVKGWGTPVDLLKAYMWTNLALTTYQAYGIESEGHKLTKELSDTLLGVLSPDQIDKAQQLAAECLIYKFKNC